MLAPVLLLLVLGAVPEVVGDADVRPGARGAAEARFLKARAAFQAHDADGAATALQGLAGELPDVADRVEALAAGVAESRGDAAGAVAAWSKVPAGSLLWPTARLAMARLLAGMGREGEALDALRPLLGSDPGGSTGLVQARSLLAAGKLLAARPDGGAEARRLLVDCWSGSPLSAEARECRTLLETLPAPNGGPPSDGDGLRRAEALLEQNRNEQALAEVRALGKRLAPPGPGAADACLAAFVRGKALRRMRQYAAAAEELTVVVESCGEDPGLRPRALYLLSVARANVANDQGIDSYRRFASDYPGHQLSDDALYYAADLLVREGRRSEAQAVLEELVERYPDGDFRAEAIFRGAWLARKEGDLDGAVAGFARLESLYRDSEPYEHARAVYWRGRTLAERKQKGDRDRARAAWEEVVRLYPGDYYGLLARARLSENGWKVAEQRPAGAGRGPFRYRAGPLATDPHFRAALVLLRLGMDREAVEELNAVDRRAVASAPEHPEPLLLLAELMDRAGDSRASHRLMRGQGRAVLREPPAGLGLRVWQLAYPPVWRDQVMRWAPGANVPPDLLQALMREESALDPAVVSAAGAVGLTQLMVPTAGLVARKLSLPVPSAQDLTDPRLNIRLGASYLGDLLRRFEGSAALALAAYNAGEGKVRVWWRTRGGLPLDEFVEEIPIQETRGYVKRVLRSYAAYRMLYGKDGERPVRLAQGLPPPP